MLKSLTFFKIKAGPFSGTIFTFLNDIFDDSTSSAPYVADIETFSTLIFSIFISGNPLKNIALRALRDTRFFTYILRNTGVVSSTGGFTSATGVTSPSSNDSNADFPP